MHSCHHFPVGNEFKEFDSNNKYKKVSYQRRYEIFCERLIREQLYDSTCLILANEPNGVKGIYREPNPEFSFRRFAESMQAKAIAYAKRRG
ncbi:MAG: PaeR7I family type II restriction endonuclease [Deltaproteobacteria bacterium]|nr:PaeR7I family type II restriction endonuclease [Deltaproteobacteria bacterium]